MVSCIVASFQSIIHKTARIFFSKCKPDYTTLLFKILQWFDTALRDKDLTGPIKSILHISIQSYFSLLYCLGLAKLALLPHITPPSPSPTYMCYVPCCLGYLYLLLIMPSHLLINSDVLFAFSSNTTSSGKSSMNSQTTPDSTLIIVIIISFMQRSLLD